MSNENHIELEAALDIYINSETINADNAQQVISEFDENWKTIVQYDSTRDFQSKYGLALHKLSYAYFSWSVTSADDIIRLSKLVEEYVNNERSPYDLTIKWIVYYIIAACWHKMGNLYDGLAIEALKKYIFYRISPLSYKRFCPTAYVFRKCDEFLYQSLANKQLILSSPAKFNDPFDIPILCLLEEKDKFGLNPLIKQAYSDCLKIACFTSNIKLSDNEKKEGSNEDEFLNSLMWAHYADKHTGICIKYIFDDESLTKLCCEDKSILAFFGDIEYDGGDILNKSFDSVKEKQAFFYKGVQWKYENELRYFYFDVNGEGDYATVDISNCVGVEAIYFGLKCSPNDRNAIQKIMEGKNVQFYEIQMDENHFGKLKAVKVPQSHKMS